jgi:alpha-beta hydrolase superfamily lysophospholipase
LFYTPNQEKLDYEATSYRTSDGEEIQFWKIKPASPSKGVILHFHGNAENMSTHFRYVSWLAKEGFWVIPHDYRGYGKSTGVPEREKIILDSKLFFDSVFQDPQMKNLPKIAIGQSLGGALLVPAVAEYGSQHFAGIVLDSTFDSYRWIAREKLSSFFITWPLQWPLGFLVNDSWSPIDFVEKIASPLVLVHAEDDSVIPLECSQRLFERATTKEKVFWKLPEGGHTAFFSERFSENRPKLLKKLVEWTRNPKRN